MQRVATYHSVIQAQEAARYLLERGVPVRVFSMPGDAAIINQVLGKGTHELHAADRDSADRARSMLVEMDAQGPPEPDEGWEDTLSPDLSRLAPDLTVPCASCAYDLRAVFESQGAQGVCPACGSVYDGAERVVATHGPEALASCYPDHDTSGTALEAAIERVGAKTHVPCLRCGYRLDGLPVRGRCPECGLRYDKVSQLRGLLGP